MWEGTSESTGDYKREGLNIAMMKFRRMEKQLHAFSMTGFELVLGYRDGLILFHGSKIDWVIILVFHGTIFDPFHLNPNGPKYADSESPSPRTNFVLPAKSSGCSLDIFYRGHAP